MNQLAYQVQVGVGQLAAVCDHEVDIGGRLTDEADTQGTLFEIGCAEPGPLWCTKPSGKANEQTDTKLDTQRRKRPDVPHRS